MATSASTNGAAHKFDFNKPLDYKIVSGKTAIVCDGAKGLGYGITEALAVNGAHVALFDANAVAGEAAATELSSRGLHVKFFKTEQSSWDSQLESFKGVLHWSGNQLDIVVATPGIVTNNLLMSILPRHRKPDEDPAKPPTKVLEIDLMGVYYTTCLSLFYFNRLHAHKPTADLPPQLLFICSMAGYDGLEFGTDYAAAKHGVRAIFKTTRHPRESMAQYQANMLTPTYTAETMRRRRAGEMKGHNTETRDIADSVEGALRCICDPQLAGRSVCCLQGSPGDKPGWMNFDLCDDLADGMAGPALLERIEDVWMPSSVRLGEDSNCSFQ